MRVDDIRLFPPEEAHDPTERDPVGQRTNRTPEARDPYHPHRLTCEQTAQVAFHTIGFADDERSCEALRVELGGEEDRMECRTANVQPGQKSQNLRWL
jgi:hypothetical protein